MVKFPFQIGDKVITKSNQIRTVTHIYIENDRYKVCCDDRYWSHFIPPAHPQYGFRHIWGARIDKF